MIRHYPNAPIRSGCKSIAPRAGLPALYGLGELGYVPIYNLQSPGRSCVRRTTDKDKKRTTDHEYRINQRRWL
jgi:hypothetical protein